MRIDYKYICMKYIGNYVQWIQDSWIVDLLRQPGIGRPKEGKKPDSPFEELEYKKAKDAGYSDDIIYFYMFDKSSVTFDIDPYFIKDKFHWWITKMLPGQFMPMHIDPHTTYQSNSKRYWMPFQDYEYGHIFAYKDTMLANYKKGDLYCYDDSNAIHGAANIGHTVRLVLQISTYE